MERGYIKLWRRTLDSGLLQHPTAWQVFGYLLMSATRSSRKMMLAGQIVELSPGDFATSVSALCEALRITPRQCRTALSVLEKYKIATIRTTNKGSVISLVNWARYQSEEVASDKQDDKQATNNRQTTDKQPFLHHINKQERENIKKKITKEKSDPMEGLADSLREALAAFAEHRRALKAPLTDRALKLMVSKLEQLAPGDTATQVAILEQSIQRGWKGIFAVKENETSMMVPTQRYEWKSPAQRRLEANLEAGAAFVRGESGLEHLEHLTGGGWQ